MSKSLGEGLDLIQGSVMRRVKSLPTLSNSSAGTNERHCATIAGTSDVARLRAYVRSRDGTGGPCPAREPIRPPLLCHRPSDFAATGELCPCCTEAYAARRRLKSCSLRA